MSTEKLQFQSVPATTKAQTTQKREGGGGGVQSENLSFYFSLSQRSNEQMSILTDPYTKELKRENESARLYEYAQSTRVIETAASLFKSIGLRRQRWGRQEHCTTFSELMTTTA